MQPQIDQNEAHEAYYYCYNDSDPDSICVYQQYSDRESSRDFLENPHYTSYLEEVEPLLATEPNIAEATLVWSKNTS